MANKIIAVDFDGTIVSHAYPNIGREVPNAIRVLKKLQEQGTQLILWTMRSGDKLDEAVAYCVKVDTPYYQHQHHAQHTESLYAEAGYAAAAESYLYRFPY